MRTKEVDVVLLCGGLGKRLRSLISDRPKSMALISGRPFLDIIIDYVVGFGFRRIILAIGYMADIIKQAYEKKRESYEIIFSEEKELLGTAGALKHAESLIKSPVFLVMNGDSLCKFDLNDFLNFHFSKNAMVSLALASGQGTKDVALAMRSQTTALWPVGVARIDKAGRIREFSEKKEEVNEQDLVNAGIYLFNAQVLTLIPENINFSLEKDLFPVLDKCYGYITNNTLIDIGTPEGYQRAKQILGQSENISLL